MNTYEDFESIQDHLPEEGDSVVIFRRDGKLFAMPGEDFDDFDSSSDSEEFDDEIMGKLIVLNERLRMGGGKIWWFFLFISFLGSTFLWKYMGIGWSQWYVHIMLVIAIFMGCRYCTDALQMRLFKTGAGDKLKEIINMLEISESIILTKLYKTESLYCLADTLKKYLAIHGSLYQKKKS